MKVGVHVCMHMQDALAFCDISQLALDTLRVLAITTACPGIHGRPGRSAPPPPLLQRLHHARPVEHVEHPAPRCKAHCMVLHSRLQVAYHKAWILGMLPADTTSACCHAALQSRSG